MIKPKICISLHSACWSFHTLCTPVLVMKHVNESTRWGVNNSVNIYLRILRALSNIDKTFTTLGTAQSSDNLVILAALHKNIMCTAITTGHGIMSLIITAMIVHGSGRMWLLTRSSKTCLFGGSSSTFRWLILWGRKKKNTDKTSGLQWNTIRRGCAT